MGMADSERAKPGRKPVDEDASRPIYREANQTDVQSLICDTLPRLLDQRLTSNFLETVIRTFFEAPQGQKLLPSLLKDSVSDDIQAHIASFSPNPASSIVPSEVVKLALESDDLKSWIAQIVEETISKAPMPMCDVRHTHGGKAVQPSAANRLQPLSDKSSRHDTTLDASLTSAENSKPSSSAKMAFRATTPSDLGEGSEFDGVDFVTLQPTPSSSESKYSIAPKTNVQGDGSGLQPKIFKSPATDLTPDNSTTAQTVQDATEFTQFDMMANASMWESEAHSGRDDETSQDSKEDTGSSLFGPHLFGPHLIAPQTKEHKGGQVTLSAPEGKISNLKKKAVENAKKSTPKRKPDDDTIRSEDGDAETPPAKKTKQTRVRQAKAGTTDGAKVKFTKVTTRLGAAQVKGRGKPRVIDMEKFEANSNMSNTTMADVVATMIYHHSSEGLNRFLDSEIQPLFKFSIVDLRGPEPVFVIERYKNDDQIEVKVGYHNEPGEFKNKGAVWAQAYTYKINEDGKWNADRYEQNGLPVKLLKQDFGKYSMEEARKVLLVRCGHDNDRYKGVLNDRDSH